MWGRKVIIATLACGVVAWSLSSPAAASVKAPRGTAQSLSLKLVAPSPIGGNGAYELSIGQNCPCTTNTAFYLYRYTSSYYGGWQYMGYFSGNTTIDVVQPSFGYTRYYEEIYGGGGWNCCYYSAGFYPTVTDNPFYVSNGGGQYVYSGVYYGGSALHTTTGLGTRVTWNTNSDYNLGVVVGTGPGGGVGTVYVDGVRQGTIKFYSSGTKGMRLNFKFGTDPNAGGRSHTVTIVATGTGRQGGAQMWLDAGVENES